MEPEKVSYKFEDGKLVVDVDLNSDGKPLLELKLDVSQIPAEAIAAWHAAQGK